MKDFPSTEDRILITWTKIIIFLENFGIFKY